MSGIHRLRGSGPYLLRQSDVILIIYLGIISRIILNCQHFYLKIAIFAIACLLLTFAIAYAIIVVVVIVL
jgi:hypothetical protein